MKFINLKRILLLFIGAVSVFGISKADKLIILHTNDTHSALDMLSDHTGGILQRKAVIDSVRRAEKNVITIDAGDAVQGTLYFKYFGGEVEYALMNMIGYDIRILGNHEFDNGMESLSKYYRQVEGVPLSANYDFTGTSLEGVFKPYHIKEIEGKRIGFIGINIDPRSIISSKNFVGEFKEIIPTANEVAGYLKNKENCDLVVVVSHIGYQKVNEKTSDIELAETSQNIDLIIGGHTHTLIDPNLPELTPMIFKNSNGKNVRIAQAGKLGTHIGKLTIDLDKLPLDGGEQIEYELIPVTDRFPEANLDKKMLAYLLPYQAVVDSVNNHIIAYNEYDLEKNRIGGLANLAADILYSIGRETADSLRKMGEEIPQVDMSIMNVGGIRHEIAAGKITEGQILSTFPFSNFIVLAKIKGQDIIEALKISAKKGGESISGNVRVITNNDGELKRVVINDKEMDPEKFYVVSTLDYVAQGNDDLEPLSHHEILWESKEEVALPILRWLERQQSLGLKINPDNRKRYVVEINNEGI